MSKRSILYLSKMDVAQLTLSMKDVISIVEKAFREQAAGQVEAPSKIGIHTMQNAFIHAMPAYIETMNAAGIKWISSYPANPERNLPNIHGLLILNDTDTGIPIAIMDCTLITAWRTGAATALSARYLARKDSSTVGIIACGVQGRANLEALTLEFPIKKVYAYDISKKTLDNFVTEMSSKLSVEVIGVDTPVQAVDGCDIVVTSGPIQRKASPTIEKDWFQPGAFASSVDFGSYWTNASLQRMDRIATDDKNQFQAYRKIGYFDHVPDPYADLADLVSGNSLGRQASHERTIAINLGLALEDIAVAPIIYQKAQEIRVGTWLDL